jgi:hypothetical protein
MSEATDCRLGNARYVGLWIGRRKLRFVRFRRQSRSRRLRKRRLRNGIAAWRKSKAWLKGNS